MEASKTLVLQSSVFLIEFCLDFLATTRSHNTQIIMNRLSYIKINHFLPLLLIVRCLKRKASRTWTKNNLYPIRLKWRPDPRLFIISKKMIWSYFWPVLLVKKVQKCAEKRSKIAVWKSIKKALSDTNSSYPAQNYLDTMCHINALLRLGPKNSATAQPAFFPVHAKIFFAI